MNGWCFLAPVALSFLLLIGSHWQAVNAFSNFLTKLVWPIQYTVNLPSHVAEIIFPLFTKQENLANENAVLQREQIYLQVQVQKLRALEAENLELRELLQATAQNRETFSEGRLINANIDPFTQQVLLNKGKHHGIEVGQPVIDASGLVGVVVGLNEFSSRVLLVTDPSFAVPIQSVRSGERAIAVGSGTGGEIRLNYVPRTADFIEGDVLVTSGLGGRFPAGYPVGVITSTQHDNSTRFTLIGVSPIAKLGQLRHVLFVKPQPISQNVLVAKKQNASAPPSASKSNTKPQEKKPAPQLVAQLETSTSSLVVDTVAQSSHSAKVPVSAPHRWNKKIHMNDNDEPEEGLPE